MKNLRTAFVCCSVVIAASAKAQDYPLKPIRIVVPFPAGSSSNDIIARALAQRLVQAFGQQVLVENRPGAGGNVGSEYVAKQPPDGYTLLVATNGPQAIAPHVFKLGYDVLRDLAPVSLVAIIPYVLTVHPSLPAKNVPELIALARKRPGQLLFASSGNAGTPHLCAELFKTLAKIDITHVPYKGGAPAMMDTIGGQTQIYCSGVTSAVPQAKAGKLRLLGMATVKRSPVLPDLPTVAEQGLPGFDVASWFGIMVPARTPVAIIQRLHAEIAKVLDIPEMRNIVTSQGSEVALMDPARFGEYLRAEIDKWGKVVRGAGLKLD
jgi:tripartite-type tricarboxylate transporter receptor subunit TctC